MIHTKEILVRKGLVNQQIDIAYDRLLTLYNTAERERLIAEANAPPDPSTAVEMPLPGSLRKADSAAASIPLQPTLYKRFHPKNPPIPAEKYRVAGAIMMKDEAEFVQKTIESVAPHVDCFVVLDTGSTDDSVEKARAAANNWNTPIYVMETSWVKFGHSRNHLLSYVETIAHFSVLLDVSDEFRNGDNLKALIDRWPENGEGFHISVQCNNHMHKMMRVIKNAHQMRFKYPVHEVLQSGGGITLDRVPEDTFYFYQDRLAAKPSTARYKRDALDMLDYHLRVDKTDCRVVYYLAQSLKDSGDKMSAYRFYLLRSTMTHGWHEERYMSQLHCAGLAMEIGFDASVKEDHLLAAFQLIPAPMCAFEIYQHYMKEEKYRLAYPWIIACCHLPDPRLSLQNDALHMGHPRWCCLGSLSGTQCHFKQAIAYYKRAQDEVLFGEYDTHRRLASDPNAKPPAPDCNAQWFTFAYERYTGAKDHPEWFADVPTSYMTAELAEKLGRKKE